MAQGGSCGVRTQGKTRVRARDAPTLGTATWVLSRDTATEYSHRALSLDTATAILVTDVYIKKELLG